MGLSTIKKLALLLMFYLTSLRAQLVVQTPFEFHENITSSCHAACSSLIDALGDKVYHRDIPSSLIEDFFSAQQQEVVPACIVLPVSAEDVSEAVKIIGQNDCIFAAKSGGHAIFSGGSKPQDGIVLDLKYLNKLSVSDDHSTAYVGTGNRWGQVYNYLNPMNITVIGGRDNQVGVGGFLLGGGISFLSRRYGWALDNVRNYEIVLANGSMASVSYSSHPDLYWALRGGGKNFGIVTRFDLETVPNSLMFGGMSAMLISDVKEKLSRLGKLRPFSWTVSWFLEQVADSVVHFACLIGYCTTIEEFAELLEWNSEEVHSDPYAQLYGWMILSPQIHTYVLGTQVNHGLGLAEAPAYRELQALKKIYSTFRVANATDFSREISGSNPPGNRQIYAVASFKVNTLMLTKAMEIFITEMEPIKNVKGILPALVMQILSRGEISHFSKNGGNALGITEEDGPLSILLVAISWKDKTADEMVMRAALNVIDRSIDLSKEMGLHHRYIYQNYASRNQDVFAGYGPENRKRLQEIQKQYDPEGVFSRLQPGYFQL